MRHLDDAELADIALNGLASLEAAPREHLVSCPDCSAEAEAFSSIGSVARSEDSLERPPQSVWERIAFELDGELGASDSRPSLEPGAGTAAAGRAGAGSVVSGAERDDEPVRAHAKHPPRNSARTHPASRHETGSGRGRKRTKAWIAGAAAVSFVLGGVVAVGIVQFSGRDQADVVEQAALEPLPGWDSRGTARVEDTAGKLQLVVDLPDNQVSGFREVWLLDLAGKTPGLLSVGTLNGDQGVFDLPPGVDLAKYNIVDVSNEPFDGDPSHSTDSIVRGELGSVG